MPEPGVSLEYLQDQYYTQGYTEYLLHQVREENSKLLTEMKAAFDKGLNDARQKQETDAANSYS